MLESSLDGPKPDLHLARKTLQDQIAQIERMSALVKKFRGLMTGDGLGISAIDLSSLTEEIVRLIGPAARQFGRSAPKFVPVDETVHVMADPRWTQQALSCILFNAMEAAGDLRGSSAQVDVRIIALNDMVAVEVSDNGPGFEDPQTAISLGLTSKGSGLGVGLALANELSTLQNGRLEISNGVEGGAIVRIWLSKAVG